MTDQPTDPEPMEGPLEDDGPDRRHWWDPVAPVDARLELLVLAAELVGLEVGVTVFVGGTTISGQVTTAANALKDQADGWQRAIERQLTPDTPEGTRMVLEWAARQSRVDSGLAAAGAVDLGDGRLRPSYLHLRGARVLDGGDVYPDDGFTVRIRLDRVDAWAPSSLNR